VSLQRPCDPGPTLRVTRTSEEFLSRRCFSSKAVDGHCEDGAAPTVKRSPTPEENGSPENNSLYPWCRFPPTHLLHQTILQRLEKSPMRTLGLAGGAPRSIRCPTLSASAETANAPLLHGVVRPAPLGPRWKNVSFISVKRHGSRSAATILPKVRRFYSVCRARQTAPPRGWWRRDHAGLS